MIPPSLSGHPNGYCWVVMADYPVLLGRVGLARRDGLSYRDGSLIGLGYPSGVDFRTG